MAEIRIEYMPLSKLLRHPRNPKMHADKEIRASIDRFGFTSPIIIDETTSYLAAGHGRLDQLQAKKLAGDPPPERITAEGGEWLVPVVRGLAFKDEHELEAYLIADNRTTELGGWDEPELLRLLTAQSQRKSLSGTGFDADALVKLLAQSKRQSGDGKQPELKRSFSVLINCAGEPEQIALLDELINRGLKCRALIS
jgi:ParB-like chromosome segregation protein Spo0J